MTSDPLRLDRADWPAIVAAFQSFFAGLGDVRVSSNGLEFSAGFTGFALGSDGSSRSFMPLHGLEASWDAVRFDKAAGEVLLTGDSTTYVYRVPPGLVPEEG